ncbi:VanZ family protein [Alkalibacillus aidingensis]|uniref:VanZ family protein n=1 Tax=Alkalibacillus aidingensis TaxID=2747607 RepID=UPI001660309C|nr:VanZ family protein [Alkalibacillus aidingensis]
MDKVKIRTNHLVIFAFISFSVVLLNASFISINEGLNMTYTGASHNLIPFETIVTYLLNIDHYPFAVWSSYIFGDILLFMPLGMLLPLLLSQVKQLRQVIMIAASLSLPIEIIQVLMGIGLFSVDQIILHIIGAMVGFLSIRIVKRIME